MVKRLFLLMFLMGVLAVIGLNAQSLLPTKADAAASPPIQLTGIAMVLLSDQQHPHTVFHPGDRIGLCAYYTVHETTPTTITLRLNMQDGPYLLGGFVKKVEVSPQPVAQRTCRWFTYATQGPTLGTFQYWLTLVVPPFSGQRMHMTFQIVP